MKNTPITTKTRDEIAAVFLTVFKDVQPPLEAKPVTAADRLKPYREAILRQRRRGLTWKQIAAGMADPRIGERFSHRTLRQVFGGKPAGRAVAAPAPIMRLVRDPVTGLPIAVPRPPVAVAKVERRTSNIER